jgi:uncharacterized membrane protein YoaT (DUF817 family)
MLVAVCIGIGIWLALNIAFFVVRLRKSDDIRRLTSVKLTSVKKWDR